MKKDRPPTISVIKVMEKKPIPKIRLRGKQAKQKEESIARYILDEIGKTWDPIFNSTVQGDQEAFFKRYGEHITSHKLELPRFTDKMLKEHFKDCKIDRAASLDGRRIEELMDLPELLLEWWAELLNDVEDGADWPEPQEMTAVTMIPKVEDPDFTQISATEFATATPAAMRPIHKFSVWVSAADSIRFRNMETWRGMAVTEATRSQGRPRSYGRVN